MVSQPTYLKNLKDHARMRFGTSADVSDWVADLKTESDRGAIILVSTALEDVLEVKIYECLPGLENDEAERKKLFESPGILSTFSAKVDFAFALKIIDKDYQKRIHLIREIRNACAHSRQPLSFKDSALKEIVKIVLADMFSGLKTDDPATLRQGFIILCNTTMFCISDGTKYDTPEQQLELFKSLAAQFSV